MSKDWKQIAENLADALVNLRDLFSCNECDGRLAGGCFQCQTVCESTVDALAAFDAAMCPPAGITVTPGRYRFGGGSEDSVGVVLTVTDGKAYGYHEANGIAQGALQWSEDGLHGDGRHANMNLTERLPEGGTPL